jgi:hypothetical protein
MRLIAPPAITITANNVTLDLNGWKLGGAAAGTGTLATGIYSNGFNVTVKNGIVRGFWVGIHLAGRVSVVEDVIADHNTGTGIMVSGDGCIVRNNRVIDTGGSTSTVGFTLSAWGIEADGRGSLVEGNVVAGLKAGETTGFGFSEYGIFLGGSHSLAANNFVTDTAPPTQWGSSSYGIYSGGRSKNVVHNTVSNFNNCIYYETYPTNPGINAAGIYARNTVTSCGTAYVGGTAGPGNAP